MKKTMKDVEHYIKLVNSISKNEYAFYITEQGKKLVMLMEHGGQKDMSRFLTTGEAYDVIYALWNVLAEERRSGVGKIKQMLNAIEKEL